MPPTSEDSLSANSFTMSINFVRNNELYRRYTRERKYSRKCKFEDTMADLYLERGWATIKERFKIH